MDIWSLELVEVSKWQDEDGQRSIEGGFDFVVDMMIHIDDLVRDRTVIIGTRAISSLNDSKWNV